jgi:hypothetical protein
VGEMQEKFDETGALIDEDFRERFEGFIDKFIAFATKISSS